MKRVPRVSGLTVDQLLISCQLLGHLSAWFLASGRLLRNIPFIRLKKKSSTLKPKRDLCCLLLLLTFASFHFPLPEKVVSLQQGAVNSNKRVFVVSSLFCSFVTKKSAASEKICLDLPARHSLVIYYNLQIKI